MGPQQKANVWRKGRDTGDQRFDVGADTARPFPHVPTVDRNAHSGPRTRVHVTFLNLTQIFQPEHSGAAQDRGRSPTAETIEHDIIEVLKRVSRRPIEPTGASELLADLGFDSLQVLELVGELEDHFNIAMPLNTLTHIRTVGDIAAEVYRLTSTAEPPT